MKIALATIVATMVLFSAFAGASPELLVSVERLAEDDLTVLQDAGFQVVMERLDLLLIECGTGEVQRLAGLGFSPEVIDRSPEAWDYYSIGLRPDSELGALEKLGQVVSSRESWLLFRAVRGTDLSPLYAARVFIAPVPHEAIAKPWPAEPLSKRTAGRESALPLVQEMVSAVKPADVDAYWKRLVDNPPHATRYSTHKGCVGAAEYLRDEIESFGLDAQLHEYKQKYAPNVISQIEGAVNPEKIYIVEGHLDDTSDTPGSSAAPGADDNASGALTVLMCAKILSCYAFKNTVRFLAVTGEEQGLYGSFDAAGDSYAAGENIQGVLNLDMPGWAGNDDPPGENLDLNYNANSRELGEFYAQCASDYGTGLAVDAFLCPSLSASDHYPFWRVGYRAVCGITDNEGYCGHRGSYPYYHTAYDTIANCGNKDFFYSVVKTTVAALAELGEPFKITMDRELYGCGSEVQLLVGDRAANTDPASKQTITVQIWSSAEGSPETLALMEETEDSMLFKGKIQLTSQPPSGTDGLLSVGATDSITARYSESGSCSVSAGGSYDAVASVDCKGPVISDVRVVSVSDESAVVAWTTEEPADSSALYGDTVPPGKSAADAAMLTTSHSLLLDGLSPCTKYYFSVGSTDFLGNRSTDDGGGDYYTLETVGQVLLFGPEDVESGAGGWAASSSLWHIDECRSASGIHSWKCGSLECPGEYPLNVSDELVSPEFDLGQSGSAWVLRWNEWVSTEKSWDHCTVQISPDGGANWDDLVLPNSGSSGGWVHREVDLSAKKGVARLRFGFHSDGGNVGEGWYVDDIRISRTKGCNIPCTLTCTADVPTSSREGQEVHFAGGATAEDCSGAIAYAWSFGDGETSTQQSPNHTYSVAGTYSWELSASADGQTCTRQGQITVQPPLKISGDCNGDGAVSQVEVEAVLEGQLGRSAAGCGDCDGDAKISIVELQASINCFEGAPSCTPQCEP